MPHVDFIDNLILIVRQVQNFLDKLLYKVPHNITCIFNIDKLAIGP
jgi:hypothetical protein